MSFSVLMSLYFKENSAYFNRSLQSIWDEQTLKPDEIVLVKDGPLSSELDMCVARWQQALGDVLKVIPLPQNVGLGAALNIGLQYCTHELVARMDTDDISLPTRFEKQVTFMERNTDITASSAWIEEVDDQGRVFSLRRLPAHHEELLVFAQKRSPLAHPVTIFRKSAVMSVGGYPPLRKSQDYGLWALLLVNGHKLANLQEPLHRMLVENVFGNGRGLNQLANEFSMFRFQRYIGFITWYAFSRNLLIRCILRLSPTCLKKLFYKYAR
jgi:glycosyltransferase involved in cell wall biosynthesis